MQHYIDEINIELQELAQLRRERALVGMPENYQHVLLLLPALFHLHKPCLPGYEQDNVPFGIAHYELNSDLFQIIQNQYHCEISQEELAHKPAIAGLYTMGSTSSLGQSILSDLDIWVCIEQPLSTSEKERLQRKCHSIEYWAEAQGVELSLFIVDVNRFRNNHHDCLIGDNCGSAQHMLLLEEFYRTANVLAGKLLLWYRIPSDLTLNDVTYSSYEECVQALINEKAINPDDWLDFGSFVSLSAEEYFGASLWQLYKSIDSPYKAVLKTLLLEAYSWEYPNNRPVAYEIKELIHHNRMRYFHLDPYFMVFNKVTKYLIAIHDEERLLLARRCLYMKVNEKLSIPSDNPNWRRQALTQLVGEWGWGIEELTYLDQCDKWTIREARASHEELLHAMMTGYRNLLNFGRRNNLEALISPQDLAILTRKLYTAFEVLPGKVSVINPNIAKDLSEKNLTFIHVKEDRVNRAGWYLYNQRPDIKSILGHQYLEFTRNLVKLVAWSYFNGLISKDTELFLWNGGNRDNSKLVQLVNDLRGYFPVKVASATEEALYGPCEIRHLAIIVNLTDDPTEELANNIKEQDQLSTNMLSYGEKERNLVGSIDLLYRNSWNEIRILNFSGELSVLDALKTVLNRMHKDADVPDSIEIFCYSKHFKQVITEQLRSLMNKCVELRLTTSQNNLSKFKPLRLAGNSWGLFFERLGVSLHQFDNTIDFYGAISNNKLQGRALNILDETNELPKEIDSVASEGIIQFFFEDTATGFDLYILNEHNQVEIYRNCNGCKESMVNDVNQFYTLADDRFTFASSSSVNFNLPQFYQIIHCVDGPRQVVPFS
ncbi:class I adenylate cyclase [Zophobihabitans entericus]|uniref:Adenylate cyclase n=1 Tax=Zophobihabitans entericus TaxID=1635327 RepID=A0A6G9IDA0_9GAMM|nr:class I adenylate cyclase [Zophobihabitans entericus]QIQ21789.1 class I adenylate cyclase [Zophobihabitans entericus]